MLKDRYTFKMKNYEWILINGQLKALFENAELLLAPHKRHTAKRMLLIVVAELRTVSQRIDVRLISGKYDLSIHLKQAEILAFLLAVQHGWIAPNHANHIIIETIDKAA